MGIAHELITRGHNRSEFEGLDGSVCLYGAAYCAANMDLEEYTRFCNVIERCIPAEVFYVTAFNEHAEYDEVLRVAKQADELLGL